MRWGVEWRERDDGGDQEPRPHNLTSVLVGIAIGVLFIKGIEALANWIANH